MVMVDEPHGTIWGGAVAAPAFQEIARFNLQHLEVPPDAPSTASR
jgi:cell division protein FtsI (penicillin-binding protein 3)